MYHFKFNLETKLKMFVEIFQLLHHLNQMFYTHFNSPDEAFKNSNYISAKNLKQIQLNPIQGAKIRWIEIQDKF